MSGVTCMYIWTYTPHVLHKCTYFAGILHEFVFVAGTRLPPAADSSSCVVYIYVVDSRTIILNDDTGDSRTYGHTQTSYERQKITQITCTLFVCCSFFLFAFFNLLGCARCLLVVREE